MAREDGSVAISVNMDTDDAEKNLAKLKAKINKTEEDIADTQKKRDAAQTDSVFKGAELDEEKRKLQEIKDRLADIKALSKDKSLPADARAGYAAQIPSVQQELTDQQTRVRMLQVEFDKMDQSVQNYDAKIKDASASLTRQKAEAVQLASNVSKVSDAQQATATATANTGTAAQIAGAKMGKLGMRIRGIVGSALIFNVLSAALTKFREWIAKTVKSNEEARKSMAQLKGALLTLAQPLINVIIPTFITLVNVLTRVINAISRVVSSLFGTTAEKSSEAAKNLYDEQNAIEGVGSAAKEANRHLSGLDEVNTFTSQEESGGGGGGASETIAPDFSGAVSEGLSAVGELFFGAALLALGAVLTFSGANIPLGLGMMVVGGAMVYASITENWAAISEALQGQLGIIVTVLSTALLVIGAILTFSGANIPLGIGLMIAGAIGLAAVVAANWDTIVEALQGPVGIIVTLISTALLALGAILAFSGANLPLGIGLIIAGAIGLAATVAANWNTISEALQGPIGAVVGVVSAALLVIGIILLFTGAGIPLGLGLILAGAAGLAMAIAPNWNFIVDKIKGMWQTIKGFWSGKIVPGLRAVGDFIGKIFKGIWNGIKTAINWILGGINGLMSGVADGINFVIRALNKLHFDVPDWIPGIGGKTFGFNIPEIRAWQIPLLAKGAVIPPNREFMAVLGDQTHGTNIEAPLATIEEGVANVMRRLGVGGQSGFNGTIRIPITLDGRTLYEAIIDQAMIKQMQTGVNPFELG